ncbi:MAG: ABC transporter permease [Rhodovibrionaceae bacterium]
MVFLPNAGKRLSWRRGGTAILLFVALWALVAHSPFIAEGSLPNPWETVAYFLAEFLTDSGYWQSWWVSFQRVAYGFLAAQLLGIPLGLLLGLSRRANAIVFPVFELLRPIPPLAWVPLSILFWPTTESSIVFITTVGAFFIIVMNVLYGIHGIPKQYLWQAKSLGARRSSVFLRIILPAILPSIVAGMVLGIAVTWNVLIAAEMIASDSGLGRLTWEGYVSATPAVVIVGMASIGLAGVISTTLIHLFERYALRWRSE